MTNGTISKESSWSLKTIVDEINAKYPNLWDEPDAKDYDKYVGDLRERGVVIVMDGIEGLFTDFEENSEVKIEFYRDDSGIYARKQVFDSEGLLHAVKEIGLAYDSALLETITSCGLCLVCLGANAPGHKNPSEGTWCCGSWVEGAFPPFKICARFKVDMQRVKEVAESIRPSGEGTAVYSVDS